MAVYAAHLTRTLEGTPSVFQVAAQEALGATVKPAFRKLFEYLAEVYPNKFGWCLCWYDELYLVFDCCLQYHYLKHYAASFSESFYGLLRVPVSPSSEFHLGQRLPRALEWGSLATLTLLPYLRDRAEQAAARWREDDEDGRLGTGRGAALRRAAVHVYCAVHVASAGAALAQLAAHLRGAASATPALAALRLALRPAPPPPPPERTWRDLLTSLATGRIGSAALSFPLLGGAALRAAEAGAFAVQLLRACAARAPPAAAAPPPPPPPLDPSGARWQNKCPICLQTWRTPTALPVSGLIFCYGCISRHLRTRKACPVTRYPAAESSLVRMYMN